MLGYTVVVSTGPGRGLEYAWLPKRGWRRFGKQRPECPECCATCVSESEQSDAREGEVRE